MQRAECCGPINPFPLHYGNLTICALAHEHSCRVRLLLTARTSHNCANAPISIASVPLCRYSPGAMHICHLQAPRAQSQGCEVGLQSSAEPPCLLDLQLLQQQPLCLAPAGQLLPRLLGQRYTTCTGVLHGSFRAGGPAADVQDAQVRLGACDARPSPAAELGVEILLGFRVYRVWAFVRAKAYPETATFKVAEPFRRRNGCKRQLHMHGSPHLVRLGHVVVHGGDGVAADLVAAGGDAFGVLIHQVATAKGLGFKGGQAHSAQRPH